VMRLPGRMDTQRALIADYAHYVARFDTIAELSFNDHVSARARAIRSDAAESTCRLGRIEMLLALAADSRKRGGWPRIK
jgi:transcription initiation factor TFIIIB Brf1 subunit/transcription initiation factor TFIIB